MNNLVLQTDIEYGIIIFVLIVLFLFCLKKREQKLPFVPLSVDKDFSTAIKGIACVMILLGHYGKRAFGSYEFLPWGVSKVVFMCIGKIALVWFMFFSGYGLSLKNDITVGNVWTTWIKRVWKVYRPYMLVILASAIICFSLPEIFTLQEMQERIMSTLPYNLHHLAETFNTSFVYELIIHSSWYVECIIWLYSIFYLSTFISRKLTVNKTVVLSLLMLCYLIFAYLYFGKPEAHYYRYPCAFMAGHLIASWREAKWYGIVIALSVILFNMKLMGVLWSIWFITALVGLLLFSIINSNYAVKGKPILFLGSISYFFYLSHVAISWTLLCYLGIKSCIVWVVFALVVAYLLYLFNISLDYIKIRKK